MTELQSIHELQHARTDSSSPWAKDLQYIYFHPTVEQIAQQTQKGQGSEQTKPDDKPKTPEAPKPEIAHLKTGDTLTSYADGQVLKAPNGDQVVIQRQFDGDTLTTVFEMEDKKGQPITSQYSHTICTMPEINVSKMSNGARLEQKAGVSTISYPNGDHVQFDVWGVTEVKRGNNIEHLRAPIVQQVEPPTRKPYSI
jgi:hypothetical protein